MYDEIQIHFLGFLRKMFIESHNFYVEESKKRFLGAFQEIDSELIEFEKSWVENNRPNFKGESEEVFAYATELATEDRLENLKLLKKQTIMSIIAGMYHKWEIQLRDWLIENVAREEEVYKKLIWKENISFVFDFISAYGWEVKKEDFYKELNICRLLVNVYKHGNGESFDELLRNDYTYVDKNDNVPLSKDDKNYWHYSDLEISAEHIDLFSNTINKFWSNFPENLMASQRKEFKDYIIRRINTEKKLLR